MGIQVTTVAHRAGARSRSPPGRPAMPAAAQDAAARRRDRHGLDDGGRGGSSRSSSSRSRNRPASRSTWRPSPGTRIGEKLTTAVASGSGPDVTQIGLSLLPTFNAAGALEDLAPYLADHPGARAPTSPRRSPSANLASDGMITSVPWVADTRVLFYRTDILAEAGIARPARPRGRSYAPPPRSSRRAASGHYGYYIPQWDAPLPIEFTWQAAATSSTLTATSTSTRPSSARRSTSTSGFYENEQRAHRVRLRPDRRASSRASRRCSSAAPTSRRPSRSRRPSSTASGRSRPCPRTSTRHLALRRLEPRRLEGIRQQSTASLALLDYLAAPETQVAWFAVTSELPDQPAAAADPAVTADPQRRGLRASSSRTPGSCRWSRRGTRWASDDPDLAQHDRARGRGQGGHARRPCSQTVAAIQ